jgi:tetratricopeptide (TPR) repeat protein/energy-coupling factor transporter ATP-binding protein EcfA2
VETQSRPLKMQTPVMIEPATDRKTIWVFTPSRTEPKDLEFILVQRQRLLQDSVERVKESALTDHKHHLLFVGPRGCGKTHLVTLIVSRLTEDDELADRLRIAWLNEDETCTTLLEFLLKTHAALEKRYPKEFSSEMLTPAYDLKPAAAHDFVSSHLLSTLGSRTLLVVTENLDAIFEGLSDAGQKQLRSFIQENPRLSIVATAQRLVEDLSSRSSPFFGFFQTEHLKPLKVEQATELLKNIASLQEKRNVVEFLATSRGRSRVRAIHHLSGGNHRIYIVLSQFITRDTVDALLEPFMKMVDELTPYYQERIRWLPPMQRKIVEYLCVCEGTVPVKEIARRLFATPQTVSSQLQDLREKGYVEAHQRGRESLYEISEPLMRICVEVKDNQRHQPLRLLVDFLRVWYEDHELKDRLGKMEPASSARAYLESAIQRNSAEGSLRKQILLEDFQSLLLEKLPSAIRDGMMQRLKNAPEGMLLAMQSIREQKPADAIDCIDEAIAEETSPDAKGALLLIRAHLHASLKEPVKEIADCTAVIELPGVSVKQLAVALVNRGLIHGQAGEVQRAMADFTAVIELPGAPVEQLARALANRGVTHGLAGDAQRAIADFTAVIELPGVPAEQLAQALFNRGLIQGLAGDTQRAIADFSAVIELPGAPVEQLARALVNRGVTHGLAGDAQRAIADFTAVTKLPGTPVEQLAVALVNRGIAHGQAGDTQCEIADYTAVIDLPGAPLEQLAMALVNRGVTYGQAGDVQREIADYTAVIDLPGAPVEQVATGLVNRGIARGQAGDAQREIADYMAVIELPSAPVEQVVEAQLALSELHFSEGRWSAGFQALGASLEAGGQTQPAYRGSATDLVGVFFSAGLNPDGRLDKVTGLLRAYCDHNALSVLGEAVVQHIGSVFRTGEPFPASDNLEGWGLAWEQAAETVPDFRLSVRLLRTGIDFVKAGGKDLGVLLTLTSPERAILEQAFGLANNNDAQTM